MRNLLTLLVLLFSFTVAHAQAAEPAASDRAAIHDVITRQIQAFQHDDATTAFGFASPSIQRQMGTPERFLDLVQNHYRPVYRPHSTRFGDLTVQDNQITQQVDVVGPDGRGARAFYSMERESDGSWRISGCVLVESEAVAT